MRVVREGEREKVGVRFADDSPDAYERLRQEPPPRPE